MNLQAEIARVQLNSLPPSIATRLLKRRDIAALIESGAAEVGNVGQFKFADVRSTLASAPLDVFSTVPGAADTAISVARSSDGMCRVRGASGIETTLPELSLLDPAVEVRLEGIKRLSDRANPHWPRALHWHSVAAEGPLADSDFGLVLDELQGVAEHVISGVVSKIERGQFNVLDVIPTSRTYYESLLGPIPRTADASRYVGEVLLSHLQNIFRKSVTWGLRCIQATCIGEAVNPTVAAADVSNDDLLSAVQAVGNGTTPSALLATHRLASSRAREDQRFLPIAQQTLETLFQRVCASDAQPGLDALLPAWTRLTLGIVGQSEELAAAPPFWRRLAAFTHATLLLETVGFSDAAAAEIADWCAKRRTQTAAAVELLDHLLEPGWRSDAMNGEDLWAAALLRAMRFTNGGAGPVTALSQAQIEQVEPRLLLVANSPDPLSGARRDWSAHDVEVQDQDLLNGVDSAGEDGDSPTSTQIWMALAHHAQIYAFNDHLVERVRRLAANLKPPTPAAFTEAYGSLALCCNVASTQADLKLAELAVAVVLEASEGFTQRAEAALAASVVILAAGATKDSSAGMQWAGEKLLALAYRMPRGACCDGLAQTIVTFQRLIPLSRRRWGKALIVASSASG